MPRPRPRGPGRGCGPRKPGTMPRRASSRAILRSSADRYGWGPIMRGAAARGADGWRAVSDGWTTAMWKTAGKSIVHRVTMPSGLGPSVRWLS